MIQLSNELERQASVYYELGVPKDSVMRLLVPRPDRLPWKLNVPVVTLGTSVDIHLQASLAGIDVSYYNLSLGHDTAGGITFGEPHLIWVQDGDHFMGKSAEWVRKHLARNERSATQYDAITISLVLPDFEIILQNHGLNFPGTSVGEDRAPFMVGWDGEPKLLHSLVMFDMSGYGSVTCGG